MNLSASIPSPTNNHPSSGAVQAHRLYTVYRPFFMISISSLIKNLFFALQNLNNYPYLQAVRFYSAGGNQDEHSNSQHQLLSVINQQNKRRYCLQARNQPCYVQTQMRQRIIHGQGAEIDGGYLRHYNHKSVERGLIRWRKK